MGSHRKFFSSALLMRPSSLVSTNFAKERQNALQHSAIAVKATPNDETKVAKA